MVVLSQSKDNNAVVSHLSPNPCTPCSDSHLGTYLSRNDWVVATWDETLVQGSERRVFLLHHLLRDLRERVDMSGLGSTATG